MNLSLSSKRRRWIPSLVVALAVVALLAVPFARELGLRAAGWALVVDEPVAPADIIVVSLDSSGAGALEAADLVQSGIATRVAVFTDPPSGEDHEFIRRGLPYDDASARQIRQLKWLGVMDILEIPRTEAGTEGEGQVLPAWCEQHQFRSIVFVAAGDPSRRVRPVSRFNPRATQALTRTDGGKLTAASGQKWSSSKNSCSTLFCIQCHFDPMEGHTS